MPTESSIFLTVLSWSLAITTITITWPQIWLSCVHRRTSGLSAVSVWLAPSVNVSWFCYGLLYADGLQLIVNALVGLGNLAVLIAVCLTQPHVRRGPDFVRALLAPGALLIAVGTAMAAAATGVVSASAAAAAIGVLGVAFGAFAALPQPLALLRDRTQDMTGISVGRYGLGALSAALWTVHGLSHDQTAVWTSSLLSLGCSAVVLCCVLRAPAGTPAGVLAARQPAFA